MSNPRSAVAILAEIRDGRCVAELSEEIHTAVQAAKQYGKPAKVFLEITVAPFKKGTEHLTEAPLAVTAEVSSKLPQPEPEISIFFVDGEGNATRNPSERQPSLGLSVASPSATSNQA